MTRMGAIRTSVVVGAILLLESLCRLGVISGKVLMPPSVMLANLTELILAGSVTDNLIETMGSVALALLLALLGGFTLGTVIHAFPRLRQAMDPFFASYYALPFFAFYPVLIVLFGLGRLPIVVIGFLFGVVVVIMSTLNGFDRIPKVLLKTAEVYRMRPLQAAIRLKLPYAAPYLFTGVKLAVAYSFIGVIAAEFIQASSGLGYAISYAFNSFDNRTMYALMLLVIILVTTVNAAFYAMEQRLLARRWK